MKKLMTAVDAAGYAMAPSEDYVSPPVELQPEVALRNGHKTASRAVAKVEPSPRSSRALYLEAWMLWLRDLFGPPSGRAAA
jgi:hypothetical protein